MTFPAGWTKRTAITIPAAQVGSGGVSSFTVLLTQASINAASKTDLFANAKNDGSDLRVSTDSAGTNLLTVDVIAYDDSAETFVIRVGTLTLSATVANTLYLWWGNAAASVQTGSGAYDSDWRAYWPLEESQLVGTYSDRTGNANTGTQSGTVSQVAGKIGNAAGTFGRVNVSADASINTLSSFTWMMWINNEGDTSQNRTLMTKNGGDNAPRLSNYNRGFLNYPLRLSVPFTTTSPVAYTKTNFSGNSDFRAIAAIFDGTDIRMFVDGVDDTEAGTAISAVGSRTSDDANPLYIGNSSFNSRTWPGSIDDVQIHALDRPAAWIETEFNQTNSPASFASSGDPVAVGGAPSVRRRSRWSA